MGSADKGLMRKPAFSQKRAIRTIYAPPTALNDAFYNHHTVPKLCPNSSFDGKFPKIRDVLNYRDTRQSENLFVPMQFIFEIYSEITCLSPGPITHQS